MSHEEFVWQRILMNEPIILKTAVEREKAVQAIDVHRKFINCAVT
jgi:hypothetical protein